MSLYSDMLVVVCQGEYGNFLIERCINRLGGMLKPVGSGSRHGLTRHGGAPLGHATTRPSCVAAGPVYRVERRGGNGALAAQR